MSTNKLPRVLIVEDDDLVSTVLCEMLDEDYEVLSATTVEAAFAVLASQRIDVVLLDYNLPGGCGKAVADQAQVPIVWMSGDHNAAQRVGTDSRVFLSKPFHVEHVLEALAKAREIGRL